MAANWDLKLSRPIGKFRRLRDVRDHILKTYPKDPPPAVWLHIGLTALEAAESGDTSDVEAALSIIVAHGGDR